MELIDLSERGWISVDERLPDEEDDVLVLVKEIEFYGNHKEKRKVYRYIFVGWRVDDEWATVYCHGHKKVEDENDENDSIELKITHWMPLPELPKGD